MAGWAGVVTQVRRPHEAQSSASRLPQGNAHRDGCHLRRPRPPSAPLLNLTMGPALDIVRRSLLVAIVLAQSVVPARGAIVGRAWLSNQINQTMCTWEQPRGAIAGVVSPSVAGRRADVYPAAVLRDAFYLDGGLITYRPGLADGTWGTPDTPGERDGKKSMRTTTMMMMMHTPRWNGG